MKARAESCAGQLCFFDSESGTKRTFLGGFPKAASVVDGRLCWSCGSWIRDAAMRRLIWRMVGLI